MTSVPALPDPQTIAISRIPEVVAQAIAVREWCRTKCDSSTANELRRRLDAFARYVADKKARAALQGESRRTEVLIGELLGPPAARQETGRGHKSSDSDDFRKTLNDEQRHDFRRMAEHAEQVEQLIVDGTVEREKILRELDRQEMEREASVVEIDVPVRLGDFREVLADVPDESADLVFTDPPYAKEAVPLYGDLAAFAARVLKPGGSLLAYCGQYALPEVIRLTTQHLRWWWLCGCYHEGGNHRSLAGIKAYVLWKPLIWLVKDTNSADEFVHDLIIRPTPDKSRHDWAQSAVDAEHYIARLSRKGGLVVDPFVGGGTTLLVAKQLERQFLGAEINAAAYKRALAALA